MTREEAFEFLDRTAKGIAEMFGSSCETLVQDMGNPRHPILSIYNGQVSGREVGSTLDILGSDKVLDSTTLANDFVNLYATTPSGQQIKSSTFHMVGEDYDLALGIDFDFTALSYANRTLMGLMNAEADLQSALWAGGAGQLHQIFEECLAALGKPIEELNKKDRFRLVTLLDQKNVFSFRKSVPFVASRLKVSRYTIYKYLGELADEKAAAGKE
ncbi:helix-turn-helix transcriptional regulator [Vermiculatibacterium agrestimuris]|uniref:helix-turn-helix transcriptional regulator n=1 Tax=Vermiculatibacterium agrestimuris TaxID=2941519 RepID=UPI00203A608C|nr:helix-turn-helix transcriptional regulator [Vermiculatibacterium agrestimuris]